MVHPADGQSLGEITQLANRVVIIFQGKVADELRGDCTMKDLILRMEGVILPFRCKRTAGRVASAFVAGGYTMYPVLAALVVVGAIVAPAFATAVNLMDTGRFDAARARRSFEESLKALGVDHIQILHLHDPEHALDLTEVTRKGGAMDELRQPCSFPCAIPGSLQPSSASRNPNVWRSRWTGPAPKSRTGRPC